MLTKKMEAEKERIPKGVVRLVIKAVALFLIWQIGYHLFLEPAQVPDKALTKLVLAGTYKVLHLFYNDVQLSGHSVLINGTASINVQNACNGLELMALYLGFLLILPSNWKRMVAFILIGFSGIYVLNVIRCSLLAYLYQHDVATADIAHKYVFKLAVYCFVFLMWMLYSKKLKNVAAQK